MAFLPDAHASPPVELPIASPRDKKKRRSSESHVARQQAMAVLTAVVSRFAAWRAELAIMSSRAARPHSESERVAMSAACHRIGREVADAHAEIIIGLAGAPQSVRGHSRVIDVEKALDGVEATIADLRDRLLS